MPASLTAQLTTILMEESKTYLHDFLEAFGQDWAEGARQQAPHRTGTLQRSITWETRDWWSGALTMVDYGAYVQAGHRVAYWGTTRVASRMRRYKTGGYVASDPFLSRAALEAGVMDWRVPEESVEAMRALVLAAIDQAGLTPLDAFVRT